MLHRQMKAAPSRSFRRLPLTGKIWSCASNGLLTWYGLADLCAYAGLPLVLGPALSMKAIHGDKAKNDTIEAQKMAVLLRGGMLPQADVYPAKLRASRDLLRRRRHLVRQRAEWLAHLQQTTSPSQLPEIGTQLADQANRAGVAARVPEPAVQNSLAVDLPLSDAYARLVTDLELDLGNPAKAPEAQTFDRLRSSPGVGQILQDVRQAPEPSRGQPDVQSTVLINADGRWRES